MTKPTTATVEDLKTEGLFLAAGVLLCQLGHGRSYGSHYGMRSTLERDRKEFYRGYDVAEMMLAKA